MLCSTLLTTLVVEPLNPLTGEDSDSISFGASDRDSSSSGSSSDSSDNSSSGSSSSGGEELEDEESDDNEEVARLLAEDNQEAKDTLSSLKFTDSDLGKRHFCTIYIFEEFDERSSSSSSSSSGDLQVIDREKDKQQQKDMLSKERAMRTQTRKQQKVCDIDPVAASLPPSARLVQNS